MILLNPRLAEQRIWLEISVRTLISVDGIER